MKRFTTLSLFAGLLLLPGLWLPALGEPPAKAEKGPATSVEGTLPADWVEQMTWRCIGPANMGGRITAISVSPTDPSIFWAATASGGLIKTTNNGVTFVHQFDREATVSIGDVCVAPSNPDIVWVGTGENNPRNSVSYGDGVYRSTDGGKSWQNMGLKKTFQIGKIIVHPRNPEVVYVGALGRLYGPNEERGLYKTTDGGKTWNRILFIDQNTGVIDMRMHPTDPDTLLVAMWERRRDGFDSFVGDKPAEGYDGYDPIKKWGPGAGIYRTTDGGKTFKKMTKGLPSCQMGRIGLDWCLKKPNVVFAILDCEKIGMGNPPKDVITGTPYMGVTGEEAENGAKLTSITTGAPADRAGLKVNDIIQSLDGMAVKSYREFVRLLQTKKPGAALKLKVLREKATLDIEVTLAGRPSGTVGGAGGPTRTRPNHAYYAGQRENVQDQQGPNSHEYGGVYRSDDGGESWKRVNSLNPRPMYFSQVRVDPTDDRHVFVTGVLLYRSADGGKTFKPDGGRGVHADHHALWIDPRDGRHMLLGTDGGLYATYDRMDTWDHLNHMALGQFYHVALCSRKPYYAYGGLQDNGSWGGPSVGLKGGVGPINEDWVSVASGDGFVCRVDPNDPDLVYAESQNGNMLRRNLRTGESRSIKPQPPRGQPPYRFNWNTPFILSSHNSRILYSAGNYVFRSLDRGNDPRIISPEITMTKRGTATALAESPRNPEVLWVGTDDGALWVTRNGGKDWTNVSARVGLPGLRWVATIEPSRFVEGRAYVAFDGHRSDDDEPHLYVTEDFGQTWKSLRNNLPTGSTRCLREDVQNANLLYLGTEFSLFASTNRGQAWTKLNNNLPTVAVHEIAIHPTAGEIVAATHGRSLWILDVTALRQMTREALNARVQFYKPNTVVRWQAQPGHGRTNRRFVGENPPPGAQLYYSLNQKAEKVSLKIVNIEGKTLVELPGGKEAGLHRVTWNLTQGPPRERPTGRPSGGRPGQIRASAAPGTYRVVLTVDGQEFAQTLTIEPDPHAPTRPLAEEEPKIDD